MKQFKKVQVRTIEKDDIVYVDEHLLEVVQVLRGSGGVYITGYDIQRGQVCDIGLLPYDAEVSIEVEE